MHGGRLGERTLEPLLFKIVELDTTETFLRNIQKHIVRWGTKDRMILLNFESGKFSVKAPHSFLVSRGSKPFLTSFFFLIGQSHF